MKLRAILGMVICMGFLTGAKPVDIREPLNLNQAPASELVRLPGIGTKRAAAIVAYREQSAFRLTSEVMRIQGIGPSLYRRLRPFLTVAPPITQASASPQAGKRTPPKHHSR